MRKHAVEGVNGGIGSWRALGQGTGVLLPLAWQFYAGSLSLSMSVSFAWSRRILPAGPPDPSCPVEIL